MENVRKVDVKKRPAKKPPKNPHNIVVGKPASQNVERNTIYAYLKKLKLDDLPFVYIHEIKKLYPEIPDRAIVVEEPPRVNSPLDKLQELKAQLKKGDTLIIPTIAHLGRNTEEIHAELSWLEGKSVIVHVLEPGVYAYCRVSTKQQNLSRQIDSIQQHFPEIPPEHYFVDKQSGKSLKRPEYKALTHLLKQGDTLTAHELDRLGRNKDEIKNELRRLKNIGTVVKIIEIPTTLVEIPDGLAWVQDMISNIIIEVYSSMAQQERDKISIRTTEGLQVAASNGKFGGRPPVPASQKERALELYLLGELNVEEICKACHISRSTLFNFLKVLRQAADACLNDGMSTAAASEKFMVQESSIVKYNNFIIEVNSTN